MIFIVLDEQIVLFDWICNSKPSIIITEIIVIVIHFVKEPTFPVLVGELRLVSLDIIFQLRIDV